MTDRAKWDLAVAAVAAEYALLPAVHRSLVAEMAAEVKTCKAVLHSIATRIDAGGICAACGGECCRTGKYHFTVVDLLIYLAEQTPLFVPRFEQALCPFLGNDGCLMMPPHRPFTCVTFNCDRLESLLEPSSKHSFARTEEQLRHLYRKFEELFCNRFMGGLLINCERNILREGRAVLDGKA